MTDARRTETSTGAVRCACVEGGANEGNVVVDVLAGEAGQVRETTECGDTREDRVGLRAWLATSWGLLSNVVKGSYLGAAITRECVVPQSLERPRDGSLVVVVVAVGSDEGRQAKSKGTFMKHGVDCVYGAVAWEKKPGTGQGRGGLSKSIYAIYL